MRPLICAGAEMRQDGNPDILHHKVFIFDNQIAVMGSFNFSASARDDNSENILIIHNPEIAAAFIAEWQARFNQGRVPSADDLAC
jgi:phosphatidylserine/phosphatidylglycerophosphate/cardiolipin synthase-like enzyme